MADRSYHGSPRVAPLLACPRSPAGVRFEASTAIATVSRVFPSKSFELLDDSVQQMRYNFTELVKLSTQTTSENYQKELYVRMYKINGYATTIAMLMQEIGGKVRAESGADSGAVVFRDNEDFYPPLAKKVRQQRSLVCFAGSLASQLSLTPLAAKGLCRDDTDILEAASQQGVQRREG